MTDAEVQIIFENNQRRDKLKDDFCDMNNICMLRIPYFEKDNMREYIMKLVKFVEC